MSQQLGNNGLLLPGSTPKKILATNRAAAWEGSTIENPSMVDYRGTTYLFYSANDSISDSEGRSNYATGYAICPHGPTAACNRVAGGVKPLLASAGVSQGPGGASPVISPQGRVYLAYASYWLGESRNGYHPRRLHIASLIQNPDHSLRVG
jgi:predicted amidohydrolase